MTRESGWLRGRIQQQLETVRRVVRALMTTLRKSPDSSGDEEGVTVYVGTTPRAKGDTLYLGNLPSSVTEREIELLVEGLGVTPLSIVVVGDAGRPKRYAFVDVPRGAAEGLIPAIDGHVLRGKKILATRVAPGLRRLGRGKRRNSSRARR